MSQRVEAAEAAEREEKRRERDSAIREGERRKRGK